jgi:hypothetical protein
MKTKENVIKSVGKDFVINEYKANIDITNSLIKIVVVFEYERQRYTTYVNECFVEYYNAKCGYNDNVVQAIIDNITSRFNDINNTQFFVYQCLLTDIYNDNVQVIEKIINGNLLNLVDMQYYYDLTIENGNFAHNNNKDSLIAIIFNYLHDNVVEAIINFDIYNNTKEDFLTQQEVYEYLLLCDIWQLKDILSYIKNNN